MNNFKVILMALLFAIMFVIWIFIKIICLNYMIYELEKRVTILEYKIGIKKI